MNTVYKEVDQILWVVKDLKSVGRGWVELGFTEMEELKKVKLISHGLRDEKGLVKASFAYIGGAKALWIQPVSGETIFSRYLNKNGEGAVALIHTVKNKEKLNELTQQLARANIGKIATYTLETKNGNLKYTIMDTKEKGKYYLGFVIDGRRGIPSYTGRNPLKMKISQYAFAIKDEASVSGFWASAGLPEFEITHGPVWDKQYFGRSADFDMKLGWQRHGAIAYEWCIPIKPPTVYADHIRMHGEGIQHLGYNVSDLDEAIRFFERNGYKISMSGGWGERGKRGSGRFAYVDLSKIGGMTIELLWRYQE
ncbi:MAG: VOC family protein [Cytophagales bacterium]|nr:VOC family protein [Cytophagales bacterium]